MGCCQAGQKKGAAEPEVEIAPKRDDTAGPPPSTARSSSSGKSRSSPRSVAPPAAGTGSEGFAAEGDLRPGTVVIVYGLTAASQLNGKEGTCERWDTGSNRWHVKLGSGEVKALRPGNLQRAEDATTPLAAAAALGPRTPDEVGPFRGGTPALDANGDPPLLGTQGASGPAGTARSARAKSASRLLQGGGSNRAHGPGSPLTDLDLSFPKELGGSGAAPRRSLRPSTSAEPTEDWSERRSSQREGGGQKDWDAEAELLSTVEDQRVSLADLDGDMQLPSLGVR